MKLLSLSRSSDHTPVSTPTNLSTFAASMYSPDSGANSADKQMANSALYLDVGTSVKQVKDSKEKDGMSKDLNDSEKTELLRYRKSLLKKLKSKKTLKERKLRKRLDKYNKPLPMRIKEEIQREKSINSDDLSPLI